MITCYSRSNMNKVTVQGYSSISHPTPYKRIVLCDHTTHRLQISELMYYKLNIVYSNNFLYHIATGYYITSVSSIPVSWLIGLLTQDAAHFSFNKIASTLSA